MKATCLSSIPGVCLLCVGLVFPAATHAQSDVKRGFQAVYHNGMDLNNPVARRVDATIDFEWGESPADGVDAEHFSVRWTGELEPDKTDEYTIYAESDDGIRIWLEGKVIINSWTDRAPTEDNVTVKLEAGKKYPLIVEFYENEGGALARLSWSHSSMAKTIIPPSRVVAKEIKGLPSLDVGSLPKDAKGVLGTYYRGITLDFAGSGFRKLDENIDFNWGGGGPVVPGLGRDDYSVRWTAQIEAPATDTYNFFTESDDGVRLWINGESVIDNWTDHGLEENAGTIRLEAGKKYDLVMEYYENGGDAVARLLWSSPSITKAPVPTERLTPKTITGRGAKQ
ncbi:MAG: PA14 domain-containing protein [Verrucomicrobiota bacterium]